MKGLKDHTSRNMKDCDAESCLNYGGLPQGITKMNINIWPVDCYCDI